jgi:hypothetical protein
MESLTEMTHMIQQRVNDQGSGGIAGDLEF